MEWITFDSNANPDMLGDVPVEVLKVRVGRGDTGKKSIKTYLENIEYIQIIFI